MKHSFAKNLLAAVVAVVAALVAPAGADMLMAQTLAEFLDDLVSLGDLTRRQRADILGLSDRPGAGYRTEYFSPSARGSLRGYLMGNVGQGRIDQYTAEIIASTLSLGGLYPSEEEAAATAESAIQGPAPAVYDTATEGSEGNMVRLGRSNTLSRSTRSNKIYNGIWGYAKGDKEYALQCHGEGLLIIDVTDPTNPVRVQLIPMGGGGIWRDVATDTDGDYAYVAAQGYEGGGGGQPDAYAIDLSYLSGDATKVYTVNESPIPSAGINNFGATGYGHTLNVAKGLLFLNTASSSSGCQVYDVTTEPMNPRYLFSSGGSGRACHDSSVFENVDGQDLWIVSEGGGQQDRIYDITNVDPEAPSTSFDSIPLLGETPAISGTYAHSNWLSEDGRFLFSCEENNSRDIIVHDVTDKTSPVRIAEFQFSEQASFNSRVHNGEIRGNYYFVSYYSGGMRTFDISNPYRPVEVGKVESYRDPDGNGPDGNGQYENSGGSGYDGGWNAYPYLPSGNILLSDIDGGTFIVKASPPYDAPAAPNGAVSKDEGTGDVSLSWNAVDNARGYNVLRSSAVDGPYSIVAEFLVSTTFTDASIGVEDAYYKIEVFNGEGEAESNVLPALVDSTTNGPSASPTKAPTPPTNPPSSAPTGSPSAGPSKAPTPTTNPPSRAPTRSPSTAPTKAPTPPSSPPSRAPTGSPSMAPTKAPTPLTNPPSHAPTGSPSAGPSKAPTPTTNPPSRTPTRSPSKAPTMAPRPPCGAKFEPIDSCPTNGVVDEVTCCSGECFARGSNSNSCK